MEQNKKIIPIFVYVVLSLVLVLLTLFLPSKDDSHKTIDEIPKANRDSVVNKQYSTEIETYISDNFVFKDKFVTTNTLLSTFALKSQINGLFVGDNALYENVKALDLTTAQKNVDTIVKFAENKNVDKSINLALVPTAGSIYKDILHKDPTSLEQDVAIRNLYLQARSSETKINVIDMYSGLWTQKDKKLFYNTDSMWTSQGAYVGYSTIIKGLNRTGYTKDFFDIEYVKHDYNGNLYDKINLQLVEKDAIEFYKFFMMDDIILQIDKFGEDEYQNTDSIYYRGYLETDTPLNVFMGEDCAVTHISTNIDTEEKIVIFGDELTDCLMQFLMLHYQSIYIIDLNQVTKALVDTYGIAEDIRSVDTVLFLYGIDNFVSENNMFENLSLF